MPNFMKNAVGCIAAFAVVACSEGQFSGSGKTGQPARQSKTDMFDNNGNGFDSGDLKSVPDGSTDQPQNLGDDSFGDTLCNNSKGSIQLLFIFDRSGSQSRSDMSSMRAGATQVVNALAGLPVTERSPTIKVASAAFNDSVHSGTSGWVNIGAGGVGGALADINQVTSDRGGDTYYSRALNHAQSMFQRVGASPSNKAQRNFLLFFSDGRPERPDRNGIINTLSSGLANSQGVAIITVATGASARSASEYLQPMALPRAGSVAPDHVGQFYEAANQSTLSSVFQNILGRIQTLCK